MNHVKQRTFSIPTAGKTSPVTNSLRYIGLIAFLQNTIIKMFARYVFLQVISKNLIYTDYQFLKLYQSPNHDPKVTQKLLSDVPSE